MAPNLSGWTASETGRWTGDQITDLTPDAQIAGIKIQFPTAATRRRGVARHPEREERREERENRELVFVFAGLPSRGGAAIGRSTVNGGDSGGRIDELLFFSANGISVSST